jgi:hypothetical protein
MFRSEGWSFLAERQLTSTRLLHCNVDGTGLLNGSGTTTTRGGGSLSVTFGPFSLSIAGFCFFFCLFSCFLFYFFRHFLDGVFRTITTGQK